MSRVPIDDTLSSELITEIEASLDDDETINEWSETLLNPNSRKPIAILAGFEPLA